MKLMTTCVKSPSVEKRGSLVAFSRNFSGADGGKNKHIWHTHINAKSSETNRRGLTDQEYSRYCLLPAVSR